MRPRDLFHKALQLSAQRQRPLYTPSQPQRPHHAIRRQPNLLSLLRLAGEGRLDGAGGIRLRAALSQSELAAMVGCTRQSANRVIGQFTDDGLIRVDRESIVVVDLAGLERTARR